MRSLFGQGRRHLTSEVTGQSWGLRNCRYFFTVTVVVLVEAFPLASVHCTVIV